MSVLLEHDCRNCLDYHIELLTVGTAAWSTCPPLPALQTSSAYCGPGTGHGDLKVVKDKVRLPQGVFSPVEQSGQSSTVMEASVEFQKSSGGKSFLSRVSQDFIEVSPANPVRERDTSTKDCLLRAHRHDQKHSEHLEVHAWQAISSQVGNLSFTLKMMGATEECLGGERPKTKLSTNQ